MSLTPQTDEHTRSWAFGRACALPKLNQRQAGTQRDQICKLKIIMMMIIVFKTDYFAKP